MLNIKNLERRWLKYKILSYLPYILVLMISIALIIGISIWKHFIQSQPKTNITHERPITPITVAKPSILPVTEENTTFLEPSMDFVQSFQDIPVLPESETTKQHISNTSKPIVQQHSLVEQPSVSKKLIVPEYIPTSSATLSSVASSTAGKTTSNNPSITINMDDTKLDIDNLVQRFKETSNANLGLFIARYYYDHGNYNLAYNYALKTNTINNRIDESWIIFAKTLVKVGKSDQAKKTLQLYISQSNSENAKGLLDSIENGSFK